jgi:hypothetical protein
MTLPLNPVVVPTITYEYLFYLLSSKQLRPPSQRKTQGLLSESCTTDTLGRRL